MIFCMYFVFFIDTATTELYTSYHTLSLHDALPIFTDVEPAARGESLTVTATVTVKGEPISTEGIVVELVCQEEIDIPSATVHEPGSLTSSSQGSRRAISSAAVFETEVKDRKSTRLNSSH